MSAQPPTAGPPAPAPPPSAPGSIRCPRCSAQIAPDQGWCLDCGAPARTRLAPTPNWQLPAVAIGAIALIAGALLAFAFVTLTSDDGQPTPSGSAPVVAPQPPAAPPAVQPPSATTPLTAPAPGQATTPRAPAAAAQTPTSTATTTSPSSATSTVPTPIGPKQLKRRQP